MKIGAILFGLIASLIMLYFYWRKFKNSKLHADTDPSRPPESLLPTEEKQNDKLVIVKDISFTDLETILTGFCNLYNKEDYLALPRVTKITERSFAISFPFGTDFEVFCYFVNYVAYPMDFDRSFNVSGWATTKITDTWITGETANKRVMVYIPSEDKEHDNVYMTTMDNDVFKLGFAKEEAQQLLDAPKRKFCAPPIDILELGNKEYKDFK